MKRVIRVDILFSPADDQPAVGDGKSVMRSARGHRLAAKTWSHHIAKSVESVVNKMLAENLIPEDVAIEQLDYYYTTDQDREVDVPRGTRQAKDE